MIIRYENNRKQTVYLDQGPYMMLVSDFLDYGWKYTNAYGKIRKFYHDIAERKLKVDVYGNHEKTARQLQNDLTNIFEYDVQSMTPGRLYIGDSWISCYIMECSKTDWDDESGIVCCEYTLVAEKPMWTKETMYKFPGKSGVIAGGVDYPFDYPYDYTMISNANHVVNDAVKSADVQINMYGPAENPCVIIGTHLYGLQYVINDGERIEINTRNKKMQLVRTDGSGENVFSARYRDQYVYDPVPSGELVVSTNGFFDYDVILLVDRSEPEWI